MYGGYDVRVFDKTKAEAVKIKVEDYTSLDTHPELILYEGYVENLPWPKGQKIDIVKKG